MQGTFESSVNLNNLNQNSYMTFYQLMVLGIFLSLLYFCLQVKNARKKIIRQTRHQSIDKNKIIIAIQIKDLFFHFSEKSKKGFIPLKLQKKSFMQGLIEKIFSKGNYYKLIFPIQKIRDFLDDIGKIERVSLVLYTSLEQKVADIILKKLRIVEYFPPQMRRFCNLKNKDDQKHAIQVDQQTRRVIIITPNRKDHRYQDDKYFLVIKPISQQSSFLRDWARELKYFVQGIENMCELHQKLAYLNLNNDTDSSTQLL